MGHEVEEKAKFLAGFLTDTAIADERFNVTVWYVKYLDRDNHDFDDLEGEVWKFVTACLVLGKTRDDVRRDVYSLARRRVKYPSHKPDEPIGDEDPIPAHVPSNGTASPGRFSEIPF